MSVPTHPEAALGSTMNPWRHTPLTEWQAFVPSSVICWSAKTPNIEELDVFESGLCSRGVASEVLDGIWRVSAYVISLPELVACGPRACRWY